MNSQNTFINVVYVLYDNFFELLTQNFMNNIYCSSKQSQYLIKYCGGFYKTIKFNWKINIPTFIDSLLCTRIQTLDSNESGMHIHSLDLINQYPQTLILRNPNKTLIDAPIPMYGVEYLFLVSNNKSKVIHINQSVFPNLRFIGYYNVNICVDDTPTKDHTSKKVLIIKFTEPVGLELLSTVSPEKRLRITNRLAKFKLPI